MLGSLHEAQSQGILLLPSFHSTFLLSPLCSSFLLTSLFCTRYNGWGGMKWGWCSVVFILLLPVDEIDLGTDHPRYNLAVFFFFFFFVLFT